MSILRRYIEPVSGRYTPMFFPYAGTGAFVALHLKSEKIAFEIRKNQSV